jgi:hypothetical protein
MRSFKIDSSARREKQTRNKTNMIGTDRLAWMDTVRTDRRGLLESLQRSFIVPLLLLFVVNRDRGGVGLNACNEIQLQVGRSTSGYSTFTLQIRSLMSAVVLHLPKSARMIRIKRKRMTNRHRHILATALPTCTGTYILGLPYSTGADLRDGPDM